MERIFCKDKKGFCDCGFEYCRKCQFAKGNGVIDGNMAHDVLVTLFGPDYDIDRLRELVEADSDGRCVVLPFKPHKTMWSCSKSNPKPAKAYYATEMGILADMKAGCVFGETEEAAKAALAKEE